MNIKQRYLKHALATAALLLLGVLVARAQSVGPRGFGELNSGITGQVTIGPLCPVVGPGYPCPTNYAPYQTTLTVLMRNGKEIGEVNTDADGEFELQLPPGTYILVPEVPQTNPPGGITFPYAEPMVVNVRAKQFTSVSIQYYTGIR